MRPGRVARDRVVIASTRHEKGGVPVNTESNPTDARPFAKLRRGLFGAPRDLKDPRLFHKMALLPLLAWIGLGADGLSSSSYGPEEAFRVLGGHSYLSLVVGLATLLTVFIISFAYSKIIEHFPNGGGGYVVATHLVGKAAGLVSGCSLIIDYVLTIAVSVVACVNALGSFLPPWMQPYKIYAAAAFILILVLLNIRGVKESVKVLAPIFVIFLLTHVLLIGWGIVGGLPLLSGAAAKAGNDFSSDLAVLGAGGIAFIFLRAYSLGGGTYTGIEAVSNGLPVLREPKAKNGKRTMVYMAISLAVTAMGLFFCYFLNDVRPEAARTLNAVLAGRLFGESGAGAVLAAVTIFSEGALLLVAAQTGFIDAPRVMANMAVDDWLPRRFGAFSERLTMRNGIVIIGGAALVLVFATGASVQALIVMYAINVFLTFALSQLGMLRRALTHRERGSRWVWNAIVHGVGLLLCAGILIVTVAEKFGEGGWVTLAVTAIFICLCLLTRLHYRRVHRETQKLDRLLKDLPKTKFRHSQPVNPAQMTALQLVGNYSGLGLHTLLNILQAFPGQYRNVIFLSVAVVDQGVFKGTAGIDDCLKARRAELEKYVDMARSLGFAADYRLTAGTDLVESAVAMCLECRKEFPRSTVFSGRLAFRTERFYHRLLHNDTAHAVQRRLQWSGITNVILPIRME
jgi:amino acid transporter